MHGNIPLYIAGFDTTFAAILIMEFANNIL